MKFIHIFFIFLMPFFFINGIAKTSNTQDNIPEKHIVVLTTSYNNAAFYQKNLYFALQQEYTNWSLLYIDDCSTDGTGELVDKYVKEHGNHLTIKIIHNSERRGALKNIYTAIHTYCKPEDIIVSYDGDDWFAHNKVLKRINEIYQDPEIWTTYGQFIEYPTNTQGWCQPMPEGIIKNNAFRTYGYTPSHLRTWYAGLFMQIDKRDLLDDKGNFWPAAWDLAIEFPLLEMSRKGHFRYLDDILLIYNGQNPISEFRVSKQREQSCDIMIRKKSRYMSVMEPYKGHYEHQY